MSRTCSRLVVGLALLAVALLGIGAVLDGLPWDQPIHDAAVDARSPLLDDVFLAVSRMGSTRVVVTVTLLLAATAWRRSRPLAVAVLVIALARPLLEFTLKELVGRDRPVGHRLVPGHGPSFPSGHPMAVAASWGLLPYVVGCWFGGLRVATGVLVVAVAASRVWLGVHWASDAVAGALLGLVALALLHPRLQRLRAVSPTSATSPTMVP